MKRQKYSVWRKAIVVLLFCLTPTIFISTQESSHCTLAGRWAEGNCYAVSVNEHVAYYATGGLLEIVDYTQPSEPQKRGSFVCSGRIEGIATEGNYAYLVGGYHGFLKILDISEPAAPQLAGSMEVPEANEIAVKDGFAFISSGGRGFYIVDISDPSSPEITGHADVEGYLESVVTGGDDLPQVVFVSTGSKGFAMIDVSDKSNPVVTYEQELEGTCRGIEYDDGILFIAGTDNGLYMYRVSPSISQVSVYDEGGQAEDVVVDHGIAYVANRYAGAYVLDVRDPATPVFLGKSSTQRANEIFFADEMIYVADTWSFRVLDVSEPSDMMLIDEVAMANNLNCFAFHGDYIYTSNQYKGIHVFDVSDPAVFNEIATFDHAGNHTDLHLEGNYAYIAGGGPGLLILDLTFPDVPWLAGQHDFEPKMISVSFRDDVAFCGLYEGGLYAIDVKDPATPAELGHFPIDAPIVDIQVAGDRAYLSCEENGFYILDISDPATMIELAHQDTDDEILQAQVVGSRAYLAEGRKGFTVLDISNPDSVAMIGGLDTDANVQGVYVDGHYAYLAGYHKGLRVLDISQFDGIQEVAYYETGERAKQVIVRNGFIYVGDDYDGIYVLAFDSLSVSVKEIATPHVTGSRLVKMIAPNPSSGPVRISFTPAAQGEKSIRIMDQKGLVRFAYRGNDTEDNFCWDGLDTGGKQLAPGIYFIEVQTRDKRETLKILRMQE